MAIAFAAVAGVVPDATQTVFEAAAVGVFLFQPYLAFRLATTLQPVARRWQIAALAGLVLSWAVLAVFEVTQQRSIVLIVGLYFVAVEGAAGLLFALRARSAVGAARGRLVMAALATGGLILVLVASSVLAVSGLRASAAVVTAPLTLLVAIVYYLAFATPRWLRRAWQLPRLVAFVEELETNSAPPSEARTWRLLVEAAHDVASSRGTVAVIAGAALGAYVHGVDESLLAGGAAQRLLAELLHAQPAGGGVVRPDGGHPVSGTLTGAAGVTALAAVPIPVGGATEGVLCVLCEGDGLFASDEFELLDHLARAAGREVATIRQLQARAFELEERNRQLESATEALRSASRAKSEFLANMSHELRTPLNSVIGFSELMLMSPEMAADPERRHRYLTNIFSSGKHLLSLINDVLDLAKVEAGQMTLRSAPMDPAAVGESVVETIQPMALAKSIAVSTDLARGPAVMADEGRFRQILLNLLSNAIKFTPGGGSVSLTMTRDEHLTVCVADTGIGIAPADQVRVFEEFQQVESGAARPELGTGLGLALTRRFAELSGGSVWVESEPGRGSRFFVRLPLVEVPATGRRARDGRPTVMVVDDNPEAVQLLEATLREAGYACLVVSDGIDVVERARRERPDIITLDILLPGEDGWEILAKLKRAPETRDIPVIVVSVVDDTITGLALGAADYLVKPVAHDELLTAVGRIVPNATTRRPRLLAVDDDPGELERLESALGDRFDVVTAGDGPAALDQATKLRPEVVIVDLVMPGMDGLEVAQALRSRPETHDAAILMLTAKTLSEAERRTLGETASHVARKEPAGPSALVEQIDRILRSSRH